MPIKRNENLKSISREHHHGLLLCWKIRTGLKKEIPLGRIMQYSGWFYQNHLLPHFEIEEKWVFPVLGNDHELIKKALADHRRLRRLFESSDEWQKTLSLIEEELERHIRFEERVLFNEIQTIATEDQLMQIKIHHKSSDFSDNTKDPFWE